MVDIVMVVMEYVFGAWGVWVAFAGKKTMLWSLRDLNIDFLGTV